MKVRIGILMIVLGLMLGSCGKRGKSFREFKKEEREAINSLIARENFEIINEYPANGVFGEKQFVLLDNGCYLNVIDSGNGNRAISGKTVVLMRCSSIGIIGDTSLYTSSIFGNGYEPLEFVYGKIDEAKSNAYNNDPYGPGVTFLSAGVESALEYVGENSIVRMIIPFDNGQSTKYPGGIGSLEQTNIKIPMYYDRIRFVFDAY